MPQREQAVVGVLAVEHVVFPVPDECPLAAPERVDEVEARLFDRADVGLHADERVQRGGGGEQVRDRRGGGGEEAALGVAAGEQPVGERGVRRLVELPHERDGGGGGGDEAHREQAVVGVAAIGGAEAG